MRESKKTNALRPADFKKLYLGGKTIDIGSGNDPVTGQAECFDVEEGDANEILKFRKVESYDCVYSSHCLEHMHNPRSALNQWWALVRPGGHLVLVVPHEDLYEQGYWPSIFNEDHKATFRLGGTTSWSPVSLDLHQLVVTLPGATIVSEEIQDHGYDHRLKGSGKAHIGFLKRFSNHLICLDGGSRNSMGMINAILWLLASLGTPIDQTLGSALAQIQIVARKDA